jgi:hypothetical protein
MSRKSALVMLGAATALTLVTSVGPSPSGATNTRKGQGRIQLVGHESDVGLLDLGDPGDSIGDQVVFHGTLRDATDSHDVGHFEGILTAVTPDAASLFSAQVVLALPDGQVAVHGELDFSGAEPFVHAITGGTGAYRNARGEFSFRHTDVPRVIEITLRLKGR